MMLFLVAQIEQFGSASDWSKAAGASGLVIFSLFVMLATVMGWLLFHFNRAETHRQASIDRMIDEMKVERGEWIKIGRDFTEVTMKSNTLLERFGDDLSDIKRQVQQR